MTLDNRVFPSSTIGFFSLYVFNQVCFQFCCTHFDLVSSQPPDLFRAQFHEIIHENTNIGFRFGFHSTHLDLVSFLSRQGLIVSQIWLSWPGARIENKTINILYSGHLFKKIETDTLCCIALLWSLAIYHPSAQCCVFNNFSIVKHRHQFGDKFLFSFDS